MSPGLLIFRIPVWQARFAVFTAMCGIALVGPGASQAWAQWKQTHKLTADDAQAGDTLGYFIAGVAIDAGITIIGARGSGSACQPHELCEVGSAYLFDLATGRQLYELRGDDTAEGDFFGYSVSISGGIAIVGAWNDNDAGGNIPGSAYLFDVSDPERPEQLHKLIADGNQDDDSVGYGFGFAVAVRDNIAIVGAPFDDEACRDRHSHCSSGSAYLFDVATGEQLFKLVAEDPGPLAKFGGSVGIDDGIAIVGAAEGDTTTTGTGAAYLFDIATGEQIRKLEADDAEFQDAVGVSVSMSEGIALVGAPGILGDLGSAYLFDVVTGRQLRKLTTDDESVGDQFGISVSISGGMAIVGAFLDDDACIRDPDCDSGSAYIFDVSDPENAFQLQKLTASDASAGDGFGLSLALSGETAVVAAWLDDDACPEDPNCNSGSAYVFALGDPCADEDGDGMVTICHIPPGNPENARTIIVGVGAVPAHLAHGDHCGPCEEDGLLMSSESTAIDDP